MSTAMLYPELPCHCNLHRPVYYSISIEHVIVYNSRTVYILQVKLDMNLYAVDFLGETLAVSGNAPIPPGAWFTWQGAGDLGIQRLQYVATDNYGQHAVCSFTLQVSKITQCAT